MIYPTVSLSAYFFTTAEWLEGNTGHQNSDERCKNFMSWRQITWKIFTRPFSDSFFFFKVTHVRIYKSVSLLKYRIFLCQKMQSHLYYKRCSCNNDAVNLQNSVQTRKYRLELVSQAVSLDFRSWISGFNNFCHERCSA